MIRSLLYLLYLKRIFHFEAGHYLTKLAEIARLESR